MIALLALPAMAQHGGARGGSGGHAAGGFAGHAGGFSGHSGFGGGFASHSGGFAPRSGSFSPRQNFYRQPGFAPRGYGVPGRSGFSPRPRAFAGRIPYRGNSYGRPGNVYQANGRNRYGDDRGRQRRPYYRGFNGWPVAYNYGAWPWYPYDIDPWLFGPDWDDQDDNSNQSAQAEYDGSIPAPYPDYGEQGPGEPGPAYGEPGPQYGAPAQNGYASPQAYPPDNTDRYQTGAAPRQPYTGESLPAAAPQQAVTLIFNNGQQPETIQNYMLTANTLTVLDGGYKQIPVAQIDIPATEAANRAQGLHFQLPHATN